MGQHCNRMNPEISDRKSILEQFNLKGKTALVTGSSRGLGAAIAVALAQAGADVAVHGSSAAPKATQHKLEALGVKIRGARRRRGRCRRLRAPR